MMVAFDINRARLMRSPCRPPHGVRCHQEGRELIGRPLRARWENIVAGREFLLPMRRLARNGLRSDHTPLSAFGRRAVE